MTKTIKSAFKKVSGCTLGALALIIAVSVVYVPRSLADTAPLCYDYNGGTLFDCLDSNGKPVSSDTTIQGGSFQPGDCYILNSVDAGWQIVDCSDTVFSGPVTTPINTAQDSATSGCEKTGSDTVCGLSIFTRDINPIIDFLAAGVGVVVTIMVVVGAIQYSTSGGNPQAAAAAKKRITNALLALVVFGLMYGLLQWIVPGGLF